MLKFLFWILYKPAVVILIDVLWLAVLVKIYRVVFGGWGE